MIDASNDYNANFVILIRGYATIALVSLVLIIQNSSIANLGKPYLVNTLNLTFMQEVSSGWKWNNVVLDV